jgi:hypothetical protein
MTFDSEDAVKKALGIESWRNLSKANVMRFAALMPDMNREVMLAIVTQFPAFTQFAVKTLAGLGEAARGTRESNDASQERLEEGRANLRAAIERELARDDLSMEDRKYWVDQLQKCLADQGQDDARNKAFLRDVLNREHVTTGVALLAAVVFVGGRVLIERPTGERRELDT